MGLWRGIGARKDSLTPFLGTPPLAIRKVLAGLFASTGGIGARSGIIYNGSTAPLGTGDATWAYNVGLFHVYVSRSASDGGTVYGNDGSALIGATGVGSTVPIAPGAGLQRIDIAWTRHPTNTENADTSSEPLFGVVSGVAASSNPVAPTALIPAGGFELFRNLMTSAATSTLSVGNTITQSALYTAVRGAPVPVRNQAERDALPLFDGQKADRLDTHLVERYNGTAWTGTLARFKGVITAGTAVTGGATWPFGTASFLISEDNLAAYNVGTSKWVAPTAGTYLVMAQIRTSTAVAGEFIAISVNGAYVATSPFLVSAISGGGTFSCYLRLNAGDGISVAAGATYTTANGTTGTVDNWLEIVQVAF